MLHRAPQHFYSDVEERALAVVWNPTNRTIARTLRAPLYYAGISRARGDTAAMVSVEGRPPTRAPLGGGDTVGLPVSLIALLVACAGEKGQSGRRALGSTTTAPGLTPSTLPCGVPSNLAKFPNS